MFSEHGPTIVCAFSNKIYNYGNEKIKLHIWDIAGQDRVGGISTFLNIFNSKFVVN